MNNSARNYVVLMLETTRFLSSRCALARNDNITGEGAAT